MTTKQTSSGTPKSDSETPSALASDDARVWLRENHYDGALKLIERVMETWKAQGKRTRRNWWEILAGNPDGTPRIAGGVEFPILVPDESDKAYPRFHTQFISMTTRFRRLFA